MHRCEIGGLSVGRDSPVRVMGVINCSPESFFSGSYTPTTVVHERACVMVEEGAEIIDIGARSTAPGAPPLTRAEEAARMEQALSALDGSGIRVSVDTTDPAVLEVCLDHEIVAVNDISGLLDPEYARITAETGFPAILMASVRTPGDALTFEETTRALALVKSRAAASGIDRYVLDPGIGLWRAERTWDLDWELCRRFDEFSALGRPLLAAVSRKSFLGDLVGRTAEGRLPASLALTALLVCKGANLVRTHDVPETLDAIRVAEKLLEQT